MRNSRSHGVLAIVMPARNEEARIESVLERIPQSIQGLSAIRTIVVDDGSSDCTGAVAAAAGAIVLRHRINLGKGAALESGCRAALTVGADYVAVMDADGQHNPEDLVSLVAHLIEDDVDLVLAYRHIGPSMPLLAQIGNRGLTWLFRLLFGTRFRDTQCGLRGFTRSGLAAVSWSATDYSVETEMLVHAARSKLRFTEVATAATYHDRYKGTTVRDGIRIFADMLRWSIAR